MAPSALEQLLVMTKIKRKICLKSLGKSLIFKVGVEIGVDLDVGGVSVEGIRGRACRAGLS